MGARPPQTIDNLLDAVDELISLLEQYEELFCNCPHDFEWYEHVTRGTFYILNLFKPANEFTKYQHPEHMVSRNPQNDRVHPLDTVSILEFKEDHKRDVENVFIHSGGYADEYARSFNAFAITMANHIYFRNGAHNPHSEEGRKLLAHELTHVAQHKEGVITKNTNKDDLEIEAETAEQVAVYEDDPIVTIEVDGEYFRFRESKMDEYAKLIADDTREWMIEQKFVMGDEAYLKLLCRYEKWINSDEDIFCD